MESNEPSTNGDGNKRNYIEEIINFTDDINAKSCIALIGAGILGILFYVMSHWRAGGLGLLGVSLFIMLASGIFGVLLGFIFGIPKTLQDQNNNADPSNTKFVINTNFEQISDWLTKIIIGVGLIELRKIPRWLRELHDFFQTRIGDNLRDSGVFGVAIVLYFSLLGFLVMYLYSRINLSAVFLYKTKQEESLFEELKAKDPELATQVEKTLKPDSPKDKL